MGEAGRAGITQRGTWWGGGEESTGYLVGRRNESTSYLVGKFEGSPQGTWWEGVVSQWGTELVGRGTIGYPTREAEKLRRL